jgi:hypothetical protein
MYLDDFGKRPPDLNALVSGKYIGNGDLLACPADKTRFSSSASQSAMPRAAGTGRQPHVSYLHPMSWSDEAWDRLMRADSQAGVVVCTLHDARARARTAAPERGLVEGLVLRGQLDGVVVRRLVFQSAPEAADFAVPMLGRGDAANAAAMEAPKAEEELTVVPPWHFFSDEQP